MDTKNMKIKRMEFYGSRFKVNEIWETVVVFIDGLKDRFISISEYTVSTTKAWKNADNKIYFIVFYWEKNSE